MQYRKVANLLERAAILERLPRRRFRHWLRISVSALMVGVAAIAGALGWVAHCARLERTASEAIFRAGGSFSYDWQYASGVHDSSARPGRLTSLLGSGHFEHVASIAGGPRFNDDVYARIGRLRQVETLITYPATMTDAGMAHLRHLTGLRKLQVTTRRASGASVANLAGLTRLGTLRLYGIPVADDGLDALAGMIELHELDIDSTRITDAGLARHIARLPALESLGLHSPRITDAGVTGLPNLARLRVLRLGGTRVTDDVLARLSGLRRLRELDLSGTLVTDAGLTHLLELTDLERLTVRRTAITRAGLAKLRKARPGLRVIR
jgi:hypothetical protein